LPGTSTVGETAGPVGGWVGVGVETICSTDIATAREVGPGVGVKVGKRVGVKVGKRVRMTT
jgi:hypothetical protein